MKRIPLRRKDGSIRKWTFVDDKDFNKVSKFNWFVLERGWNSKIWHASRIQNGKQCYLHHFLIGKPSKGYVIDHKDGNGLHNWRSNLRVSSIAENIRNQKPKKGKFKGITYDKSKHKWQASIMLKRKTYFLGRYKTKKEAAQAYNNGALKFFGEFSKLNIIK